MKKILFGSTFLLLLSLFFVTEGCKKETINNVTNTDTVYNIDTVYQCATSAKGLWVGTYTINSLPTQSPLFISLTVYPDGTIMVKTKDSGDLVYFSMGTWTLNGSNFSATFVSIVNPNNQIPVTQKITGSYSDETGLTNVTWNDTVNANGPLQSGSIQSLVKVN